MEHSLSQRAALWFTLFFVGIGAALAGVTAAFLGLTFLTRLPPGNGMYTHWPEAGWFLLASALASLLIGPSFWWCLVIRPNRLTLRRGAFIGMLGSLLAHPLVWFLAISFALLTGTNSVVGIGFLFSNPIEILEGILFISFWSLFFVGWITLLIGGVLGGLLAFVQQKLHCQTYWIVTNE